MFLQNGTTLSSQTVWRVTKSQAGSIYFVKFFIKKTLKTKNRILTKWDDIVVPNCVGLKFFGWLQIFVKTCGTIDNMGRHMSTLFFCSSPDACFVVKDPLGVFRNLLVFYLHSSPCSFRLTVVLANSVKY